MEMDLHLHDNYYVCFTMTQSLIQGHLRKWYKQMVCKEKKIQFIQEENFLKKAK